MYIGIGALALVAFLVIWLLLGHLGIAIIVALLILILGGGGNYYGGGGGRRYV